MLNQIKSIVRTITPEFVLKIYHFSLAHLASIIYGQPSTKLIVIGVTGTNGKSTTANLIAKILDQAGYKTAVSSTVNFKIGDEDVLNQFKMTMPGRFFLQKFLKRGVDADCQFAVIESSSEGVLQYRHKGIHYDVMVFTNLTPEHIEAHGGFENYKNAKLTYFKHLENLNHKTLDGKKIPKVIVVNDDDQHATDFMNFKVDRKITFGKTGEIIGTELYGTEEGIKFKVRGTEFILKLKGEFNFYNALAAIAAISAFDVGLLVAKKALEKIENIPGRMELINEGQNFKVMVDYAPEPESLRQLYKTISTWKYSRLIHLLGSTGGGRDKRRRQILGKMAGEKADIVIVTNEDPYDDDPQQIIDQVGAGAGSAGKVTGQNLFQELDRRKAIAKALAMAKENDLVLITGKGSEQKMAVKNGYIDWDDRVVAREELIKTQGISSTIAEFVVEFQNKFSNFLNSERLLKINGREADRIKLKYFEVCKAETELSDWDLHCWLKDSVTAENIRDMANFIHTYEKFSCVGHMLTLKYNSEIFHNIDRVPYVQFMAFLPNETSAPFIDIHLEPEPEKRSTISGAFKKPLDDEFIKWLLITYWRKLLIGDKNKIEALTPYLKKIPEINFDSAQLTSASILSKFRDNHYYQPIVNFLGKKK